VLSAFLIEEDENKKAKEKEINIEMN